MSLSDALREKMDLPGAADAPVQVECDRGTATVDAAEVDGLGVRVRQLKVKAGTAGPLNEQVERVCDGVRGLGERLVPVEVDERVGRGILRSDPRDMRGTKEYFEVDLAEGEATLERYKARPGGGRDRQDFTVTREQLGRVVDDLLDALDDEA